MDWLMQLNITDALNILRKELLGEITVMENIAKIAKAQGEEEVYYAISRMLDETKDNAKTLEKLLLKRKDGQEDVSV